MAFIFPTIPTLNVEQQDPITGLVSKATIKGVPPVAAGIFSLECMIQDLDGSGIYQNTGTVAVPIWTAM